MFFYFLFFLLKNWRTGGQNKSTQGRITSNSGRGEMLGKRGRIVNIVQKMCKCHNVPSPSRTIKEKNKIKFCTYNSHLPGNLLNIKYETLK
jgi:hypothetical protein